MRDELERLELMIGDLKKLPTDKPLPADWNENVLSETRRIRKAFMKEAFGLRKEKLVELYIQYHQTAIVKLIDQLVEIVGTESIKDIHRPSTEITSGPGILYQCLEQLLTYIEKYFSRYFNQNAKSPESYRFIVHREISERIPDIRYGLEKKGINKRLLSIILNPFDNFLDEIYKEEASYRKIIYLKELMIELDDLLTTSLTGDRFDFKVCLSLGYINFNSQKFFKFCVREITRIVQDQPTLNRQIEKLAYMTKVTNQVQIKPGFIFNIKSRSIKDQLSEWISAEICFFEKRQQLAINFPENNDEPIQPDFKIKLNLSVAQLGYLLRSLKELNIIQNNNMFELMRFVAGIVKTPHTENVSWESLRSKFYKVEDSARTAIKQVAINLLDHTEKM